MTAYTIHATSKRTAQGYIPMLTLRGAKGRMGGSYTPKGARLDTCTYTDGVRAEIEARCMALRVALARPEMFRVSEASRV